jgi:hypothetical protein
MTPVGEEERRISMSKRTLDLSIAVVAASITVASNAASATPFADALAIKKAAGTDLEMVWGRGFGWGVGAGFLGGAIIGGALAAPYYGYPYSYYRPYYGHPYPYYGPYYGPYSGYGYPFEGYRGRYSYDRQLCCRF